MADRRKIPSKMPLQYRSAEVAKDAIDVDKRTVDLAFSSETPVLRSFFGIFNWNEVLDHSRGSVNMSRMKDGAAGLVNHDPDQLVAVVEKASISDADKVGRATVRFGTSPRAEEAFQNVRDGILRHISVGYIVHQMDEDEPKEGEDPESDDYVPTYRATDWEPVEVSFVAVPADPSVGVGRGLYAQREFDVAIHRHNNNSKRGNEAMASNPVVPSNTGVEVNAEREKVINAELQRVRNVSVLGSQYRPQFGVGQDARAWDDQVAKWIAEGTSEVDVRQAIGDKLIKRYEHVDGSPAEIIDLSPKDKKRYSIVRAVNSMIAMKASGRQENCFEFEVGDEIAKKLGRGPSHGGIFVPTSLPSIDLTDAERQAVLGGRRMFDSGSGIQQRTGLVAGTGSAGGLTIETEVQPLIEILRNKIVAARMGARFLTGLRDQLLFPRQITAGAGFWMSENSGADVTEQDLSFGSFTMSPKTVMALQKYSRQLMAQSTLDIEALVRTDIAAQLAIAIDAAVLNGSGSSGQPSGILQQSGLDVPALGTNGAQPTFGNVVQQETDVATANADIGSLGYVTTPGIRGRLKQTAVLGNTIALPIWTNDQRVDGGLQVGEVNGYPAMASNQVPSNLVKGSSNNCHAIIFGDWNGVLIGEWGAMELLADPYTLLGQAMIRLVGWALCDTNVRYVASYSVIKDALP